VLLGLGFHVAVSPPAHAKPQLVQQLAHVLPLLYQQGLKYRDYFVGSL
jgi:hypothetical protein